VNVLPTMTETQTKESSYNSDSFVLKKRNKFSCSVQVVTVSYSLILLLYWYLY